MNPLAPMTARGGLVEPLPDGGQRLSIPSGPAGEYRLAQLDDTQNLPRGSFNWQPPCKMLLRARVSAAELPGTWGFGLWNDPFTASLGFGGGTRKLPELPRTAWFFHASSASWLSLRDDLPANGFLAATFCSRKFSPLLVPPAVLAAPLLVWRVTARWIRRIAQAWIKEDSAHLNIDPTNWHNYQLDWLADSVSFKVDGRAVLETAVSPHGPLGLVIWIDNQYAAFTPQGRLGYGTQVNLESAWLKIDGLQITSGG
ncbi:MAG TPA: hypothetical protein VN364_12960 [Bellilinea sp.]|nr:hypothetical protein [Bellilinea sp.]